MTRYLLLCCCLLFLFGCEQQSPSAPSTQAAGQNTASEAAAVRHFTSVKLLHGAVTPYRFELPSEALQVWRRYRSAQPALVLFSAHPLLQPLAPGQQKVTTDLLANGKDDDFYRRGSLSRSDPALSPLQTLNVALDNGLFSEVVWFFPTREKLADFSPEKFTTRMSKAGFIAKNENPNLHLLEEGVIGGTVHGVPLRIIHPLAALPELNRPALVHVDLGYFRGLYKNEVSTPLYNLLRETALTLRDADFDTLAVSLSYSTEGGAFSLSTRFLISDLTQLIEHPDLLGGKMPAGWRYHSEALYAREMYQEGQSRKLIAEAAEKYPDDPAVLYVDLQNLLEKGRNDEGFKLLDRIVKLDPGYAMEYLSLAETGVDKGWLDKSLELLDKASAVYPDDPFILLYKIDVLKRMKRETDTLPLIKTLQQYRWSKLFYPQMPQHLADLAKPALKALVSGGTRQAEGD